MGAIDAAVNTGLGMVLGEVNDARQRRQQRKLQEMQIQGQMKLGEFNREQAMKMWEDTNYAAQRKQLEKAGLNIGLMYGTAGGGGTTQGGAAGSVTGASAPTGGREVQDAIGMGLTAELQKAQIENIKANTEKTKVDTTKTGGVDTDKARTEINNILQATSNAELQAQIMQWDKTLKEIQANREGRSMEDILKQISVATDKLIAETQSAKAKGNIDQASQENVIKGIELANEQTKAGITATQAGTKATEAGTKQTEQKTENLKQEQLTQELQNQLRQNGVEPNDSPAMRIISRVINNTGSSLVKMQSKMSSIIKWLKGQNGSQTEERFNEIWKE